MSAVAVQARHPANKGKAIGLALLVHLVLLAIVGLNWRATSASYQAQNVIQAIAITEPSPKRTAPAVDVEKKQAQIRKQKKLRRKAERLKKKKIAKRRAIAKRKSAATKRHAQAKSLMQQQLAAEESERNLTRRSVIAQNKAARFIDMIGLKVSSKWRRPPGSARDAYCIVRVRVTPGGRVLSVTLVRSSGDDVFDRATVNAIYLAEPLPVPSDADVFEVLREFNIDTQKL